MKAEFVEMLSEDGSLSESSQWRKVKGGLERDTRYRAVSSGSSQREEWFLEYIKSLATGSTGKVGWLSDLRHIVQRYLLSVYAYVVLAALFLLAFESYIFQMFEILFCVGKRN